MAESTRNTSSKNRNRAISPRTGEPLFVQDAKPAHWHHQQLAFSSSSPINAAALDGYGDMEALVRKYDPTVLRRARRRQFSRMLHVNPKFAKVVPLGMLSLTLYAFLFIFERDVLRLSTGHSWSFLVPVSIALLFSFVHGSFTGAFWDVIGLKPNAVRK